MVNVKEMVKDLLRVNELSLGKSPFSKSELAVLRHMDRVVGLNRPMNLNLIRVVKNLSDKICERTEVALMGYTP